MPDSSVTNIMALLSLLVLIALAVYLIFFLFARKNIENTIRWIGKHSLLLSFLVSIAGVIGSLIYSEFFHYQPCVLCWVQRIFLYPQAVIFFLAVWIKDYKVWFYSIPLSVLGGIIALYHAYTQIGGVSLTPCTSVGGACSKVFVLEYGFITIPSMAAIAFLTLIFLALHMKYYSSRH